MSILGVAATRLTKRSKKAFQKVVAAQKAAYYRIRETPSGRAVLSAAEFARNPFDLSQRRRVAAEFNSRVTSAAMDPAKGYCLLSPDYFAEFEPVFQTALHLFEHKRPKAAVRPPDFDTWSEGRRQKFIAAEKRSFLQNLLNDDDLRRHPELVDFALSDKMLGIVTKYLGTVPYLSRIDLVYSQPRDGDQIASQLFHVDPEGLTQVKFFIYLFDVDDPQGPFTFIPADDSDRILQGVRANRRQRGEAHVGRYRDDEVAGIPHQTVEVKGPRGAAVAVDTSRCLHLGSRVKPGAFRLVLYLQYCPRPQRSRNVLDTARYQSDPVRLLSVASAAGRILAPDRMAGDIAR